MEASRFIDWLGEIEQSSGQDCIEPLSVVALGELVSAAIAYADDRSKKVVGEQAVGQLACGVGCAWCCYLPVQTTVGEAAHALNYAFAHYTAGDLAALRARVLEAAQKYPSYAELGPRRHEAVPCPFLIDHACSVYPARPLTCRGWNSYDSDACRRACDLGPKAVKVPVNQRIRMVYASAGDALARGLARLGVKARVYLVPTVFRLLGESAPEAFVSDWLRGSKRL